uniref:Myosin tail domain-containing protein n=2 Tax=Parascaris univalens TaxID=6257 RepID=A0A915ANQ8_PARUN
METSKDASSTETEHADVTQRVTRTVITRTNYESSVADTNIGGDVSDDLAYFDVAESLTADSMLASASHGSDYSVLRLDRAQDDLSSFKKRIDANAEEQREHADLMAGLQRKVEDYRRRIAEIERQVATRTSDDRVTFNISEVSETWTPEIKEVSGVEYEFASKLDEERRKVEELRMHNTQLQAEIQHLRQQFDLTIQEKERSYQIREKNLAQYLSDEQKRMMDLWTELQHVRRQFGEYKDQTERELENQRNEFARISRGVGGFARQLNLSSYEGTETTVINQDSVLMDAVRRFREQQAAPMGASAEDYDALMKKYEEAIERIVELESSGDGSTGKLSALETQLRRNRDKLAECREVLRKIYDLTKESNKDTTKRARSLSPGGTHVIPSEVLRSVRYAIRTRDNELQQLQRKLKNTELQITELLTRLETAEEARKRLEKQLTDSKKELTTQMKSVEDANRELKRLEERLRASDSDKTITENARRKLEEEVRRLKTIIDQSDADDVKKALEEAEAQNRFIEEEYKTRIAELSRRTEGLVDDNKRLKGDLNGVKDKYRNLEIQYNITLQKLDEKDFALKNLEDSKRDLLKDLEDQRVRFDTVTNELDNLQTNFTTTTKNTVAIEMTVKEIKQQRDDLSKQKDDLSRQLADLSHKIEVEIKKREEIEKTSLRHVDEIEKLKAQITDYESQLMLLRRHNDELDTQLKTSQAKITTTENSLASAKKEITTLNELNGKLQNEKHEIMNSKQNSDVELDAVKEKLRKVEIEIEKLSTENKALIETEQTSKVAYKDEENKVHVLERELDEAKTEIDELRRQLTQLDQEKKERLEDVIRLRTAADKSDTYESTHITEIRVKELGDRHKLDLERLENERDEIERRLQLLQDELAEKQRIVDRQVTEIEELKQRYESEINAQKSEMIALETKYQNEHDDERDQHQHDIQLLKASEDELRDKIELLERKLQEAIDREKILHNEITEWEEKYDTLNKELEKVRDEVEAVRSDAEKDSQKWKTEIYIAQTEVKNLEAANETLKAQLSTANERANSLNRTTNEQAAKIRELNSHIRRLDEELTDSKALVSSLESDLESAQNRLHTIEEQYAELQLENNKIRAETDMSNRQIDVLKKTNASNESEIERLKKKVVQLSDVAKQQADELDRLQNERDQLDKAYREKAKHVDQLSEMAKTLEMKMNRMRQELHDITDKLTTTETERNILRTEMRKLEQELQFGKDQMLRKTDEFHAALDDLANAHRAAEDGRVSALQELETRKFELSDLKSRLDNAEERLGTLQQEYIRVDKERDVLSDSLRRFQSIISRTVIPESGPIDMQTIDVHVQKLMTHMEKLERERNDYRESLGRLKRKTTDAPIMVNKHETFYRSIEERVADVEEGKRSAEMRLASAKELLKSQEEALKQRDDERRTMKSKIVAYELETRGKEAQIRHLNELVKTLKADLETSQSEVHALRDREEQWDMKKTHLEGKLPGEDAELRVKTLMSTFETERQNLNETIRKLTSQLHASESMNADLKDDADKLRRDLTKAERAEAELRRNLDEQTRLANDRQQLKDQLTIAQNDLANANSRKQQLENELMNVRTELRDLKQQLHDANSRIADLQRQLQDANTNKNRLSDKVHDLERTITLQHNVENQLRNQLSTSSNEQKTLQNVLDELRRRIDQMERDKHGMYEKIEEFKKIRITLIKKIDILETEKRNAEGIISETAAQREAIERSLSALERENKELARNCAQLQQQIAQLELDNGNRLIMITNKQKEEHEKFVQSMKAEKAQVERIVENRDRARINRIKQLENQLNIMREQLNNERLRRRDASDRLYMSSVSKLGGSVFGMGTAGMMSAGPAIYPHTDSFDYVAGSPRSLPHFYTAPTTHYSSLPISDTYRFGSTVIAIDEPTVDTTREVISSTYRSSAVTGAAGQSTGLSSTSAGMSSLAPSAEIGDSEIVKKTTITVSKKTTTEHGD